MKRYDPEGFRRGYGHNPSLPKNIGREAMYAYRHALRAEETRAERGLPRHPDGSGWAMCPDCEGAGEITINETNPHGHGPDPQCDESVDCLRCIGGEIADGHADPIASLAGLRRRYAFFRAFPSRENYKIAYERARRIAFVRCSGIVQADMLAMSTRCVNRVEDLGVALTSMYRGLGGSNAKP